MRCYQEMGLTGEAEAYLEENCVIEPDMNNLCRHCGKPTKDKRIVLNVEHVERFFNDGPYLHTYKLKDGRRVKEVIQAEPWSSGPVCFLCLEIIDAPLGKTVGERIGEWPRPEIENA